MICPSCKTPHENVPGKCPHCGADDILRHWPCPKCERSAEDCEDGRRFILRRIKEILIHSGVPKFEVWERAEKFLAAVDSVEAQKSK